MEYRSILGNSMNKSKKKNKKNQNDDERPDDVMPVNKLFSTNSEFIYIF